MRISDGLVVFISGGASGLGEATVRMLHAKGASVAVADMNDERLNLLAKELKERYLSIKCDVTKEGDVKNAVEKTVEKFGALHVAIPCAGVAWPGMTLTSRGSLDMDLFENVVKINLYGSAYVAKYAAVAMSKNKPVNELGEKGVIIFVSSVAAEEG